MTTPQDDAVCLLRQIRSRHSAHVAHMIEFLEALADCMASAKRGTKIPVDMLTSFLAKSAPRDEAIVRVLLMVMATRSCSEGQLRHLVTQLQTTQKDRRKPIRPRKEARERNAQQLF